MAVTTVHQAPSRAPRDIEVIDDGGGDAYSARVGERLRAIRKQKHLSLQEVEEASALEFKASVLGAYERGERAISVPRLQRLAAFYELPVEQLLPAEGRRGGAAAAEGGALTIDLRRAQAVVGPEGELLKRYLTMIQVLRQDFNGRMLTIRASDLQALSCLFGVPAERVRARMAELGLLLSA